MMQSAPSRPTLRSPSITVANVGEAWSDASEPTRSDGGERAW